MAHIACPKCSGSDWKSAKLIVLEGTTLSEGTASGTITNPGLLSGGARTFLLADRWFSWEHQLDADVQFTTRTGLVDEVKRMLVERAAVFPTPVLPVAPKRISALDRITPSKPTKPKRPAPPTLPTPRSWFYHFARSVGKLFLYTFLVGIAVGVLATGLFAAYLFLALGLLVIGIPVSFFRAFSGNKRAILSYEKAQSAHETALVKYQQARVAFREEVRKFRDECDKAERQEQRQRALVQRYETQMVEYNSRMHQLQEFRESLWERARMCMRCGTAYLSPAEPPRVDA
jgi:hypothetical protein